MVVALDLLSGLVQGLDNLVEPLIAKSEPPLLSLVAVCVHVSYAFNPYSAASK